MDDSRPDVANDRTTVARHFAAAPAMSRGLVFGVTLAVVAESVGVHALLYRRWPVASIVLLVLNVVTIWWIVREAKAESRVSLDGDRVVVRHGRSVRVDIPRGSVRDVRLASWQDIPAMGAAGYLPLVSGDDPNVLLTCDPPARAQYPMGLHRSVGTLGLRIDAPGDFVAALQDRRM